MKKNIKDAFEDCVNALRQGEMLETCIMRYPELADELRPLLESIQLLSLYSAEEVSLDVLQRNKGRIQEHANKLFNDKKAFPLISRFTRRALVFTSILLFLIITGSDLIIVSARALPGEALYALKRTVENTQLKFVSNSDQKKLLEYEFRQRRLEETEILLSSKKIALVEFDGVVQQELQNGWLIEDIPVVVTPNTFLEFVITIGGDVEVIGQTQMDGSVIADRIDPNEDGDESNNDNEGLSSEEIEIKEEPSELETPGNDPVIISDCSVESDLQQNCQKPENDIDQSGKDKGNGGDELNGETDGIIEEEETKLPD
jgi:hypothetical protein